MGDEDLKRGKNVSMMVVKSQSRTRSLANLGRSQSRMKMRKQSFGFGGVPGIRPIERTSQLGMEFKRPPLVFLNTYQLEPKEPFHIVQVSDIVNEFLDEHFDGHKYNVQNTPALALKLSGEIMRRIKWLFNRYRIISVVTMGQKRAQSYNNAVTFLWDHERDNYVDIQRETNTCFIQITVFGVYFD